MNTICNTCGKASHNPFRVVDQYGKVTSGCIDAFHADSLIGESARWHNRPIAKKMRAASKLAFGRNGSYAKVCEALDKLKEKA